MTFTSVDVAAVEPTPGEHPAGSAYDKNVGRILGVRAFGVYQVELPPGAQTVCHDHSGDGDEDVYAVIRGSGSVIVDGHEVPVTPGRFVAVTPESERYVRAGSEGIVILAVCAALN